MGRANRYNIISRLRKGYFFFHPRSFFTVEKRSEGIESRNLGKTYRLRSDRIKNPTVARFSVILSSFLPVSGWLLLSLPSHYFAVFFPSSFCHILKSTCVCDATRLPFPCSLALCNRNVRMLASTLVYAILQPRWIDFALLLA